MNLHELQQITNGGFGNFSYERIFGGGNNRLYKIVEGQKKAVAKFYCDDKKDRAYRDVTLSQAISYCGITSIARILYSSIENNFAIFEYLDGKPPQGVSFEHVLKAAEFIKAINCKEMRALIPDNLKASESFDSPHEHLKNVEHRVRLLLNISQSESINRDALIFVKTQVQPCLESIKKEISSFYSEPIDKFRIVSPSDFGFHNAIQVNSRLFFFDFEYGGWDDPTKMLVDFFSHPGFSLEDKWLSVFMEIAFEPAQVDIVKERLAIYMKVLRLKWICIILNEFKNDDISRRVWASDCDKEKRKKMQLEKAKNSLPRVNQSILDFL